MLLPRDLPTQRSIISWLSRLRGNHQPGLPATIELEDPENAYATDSLVVSSRHHNSPRLIGIRDFFVRQPAPPRSRAEALRGGHL